MLSFSGAFDLLMQRPFRRPEPEPKPAGAVAGAIGVAQPLTTLRGAREPSAAPRSDGGTGKPPHQTAFETLNIAADAIDTLVARVENLNALVQQWKDEAAAKAEAANHWMQLAQAYGGRLDEKQQALAELQAALRAAEEKAEAAADEAAMLKLRAEGAQDRAQSLTADCARLKDESARAKRRAEEAEARAAALAAEAKDVKIRLGETEAIAGEFFKRVMSTFGTGSRAHAALMAVAALEGNPSGARSIA